MINVKQLILTSLFFAVISSSVQSQDNNYHTKKIEKVLLENVASDSLQEFVVILKSQADLSGAKALREKTEKGKYVYHKLRMHAQATQGRMISLLEAEGVFFQTYFLVNMIHVEGSVDLIRKLATLPEVKYIGPNPIIQNEMPVEYTDSGRSPVGVEWGIQKIQADQVWSMGIRGQGVVVGGQDTGYEWYHPALQDRYRGWDGVSAVHDYHWHDAIKTPINGTDNPCGYDVVEPCDDHLHGTHTMGTMIGEDGENLIGVAPDAQWIGCRNMDKGYGTPVTYIECFEWFLAPTDLEGNNPEPDLAPHVINNSWSCPESEGCFPSNFEMMEIAVNNLKAAGVVVVVSAGNEGSQCETINRPPAIFSSSFAIGATNIDDMIAGFSSRGPVVLDTTASLQLKPDVSAPGVSVRSSMLNGSYGNASGTSMAGPHVAGLVALIISANPALAGQVDTIEQIIRKTTIPIATDQDCGGIEPGEMPNNTYGYGRVDALKAVTKAMEFVSDTRAPIKMGLATKVFPNPFRNELQLEISAEITEAEFSLYDTSGKLVTQKTMSGGSEVLLKLPDLMPGQYYFKIVTEKEIQTGKLIKQ